MNLIEQLGLENAKTLDGMLHKHGVPESWKIAVINGMWQRSSVGFTHGELRTAIANHGTPTNKGTSIIDQFINSGGFDTAIQQQLQSELNNCSASNSSKNSIEDNCSDICNHLSPLTGVTER